MKGSLLKFIPILTTFVSHFMKEKEHNSKIKNHNKTEEKITVIENLIVRLERKLKETREEIIDLRHQIMINRIINIILSLVVVAGIVIKMIN